MTPPAFSIRTPHADSLYGLRDVDDPLRRRGSLPGQPGIKGLRSWVPGGLVASGDGLGRQDRAGTAQPRRARQREVWRTPRPRGGTLAVARKGFVREQPP